jgi:hypothetical protein
MFYAEGAGWAGLASEIKGFPAGATHVEAIEPGTVRRFRVGAVATEVAEAVTTWHQPPWLKVPVWRASVEGLTAGGQALAHALEEAVAKLWVPVCPADSTPRSSLRLLPVFWLVAVAGDSTPTASAWRAPPISNMPAS